MKILIVSQFYPPDITAAAFRIGDMVSYLIDKNNEVRVITAEPHKGRLTSETSKDSGLIIRVPLAPIKTGGILNYIKQYGSFSIAALRVGLSREIRQFSPDIVVATSPPLFVGITGWMLSIILNTKFVLDVRDIWPDSIVAAGQMRPNSLAWKITKYLEKFGMPKSINDLNKHRFISFGKGAPSPVYNPDWALKLGMHDGKKRKPIMKVNSVMGLLLAVEAGVGLAALPEYLVSNSNNVIKVLPKSEGPITEAHFVYPQSLKNTARVQAFRNFLFSKIGDWNA